MKTRILLTSMLVALLLVGMLVPAAIADEPVTDDVGAVQLERSRPVELSLDAAAGGSVEAGPWSPDAPVTLMLDDGTTENYLGVNDGIDGLQFLWVNRFTPDPAEFPFDLTEISVVFGTTGVFPGDAVQLIVYEDTDGDGDLNNASLVATVDETIQVADGFSWSNYTLATPITLNGPGDVAIGVINRYQQGVGLDYPAAVDQTASQLRSWVGWWTTDIAPDPPYLPPDVLFDVIDPLGFPGNWMVRGVGETSGGDPEPDIVVDPLFLGSTQCADEQVTMPLDICNVGTAPLDWTLTEIPAGGRIMDVLWDNGPLVTHPGGGYGGADLSSLQTDLGLNTLGVGHQYFYGYRIADDFPVDGDWAVDTITFFAYQTNSPTDPSPMTQVNLAVWDGLPGGGGSIIWGDYATNCMVDTGWSNIYRAADYDPTGTARPIMANVCETPGLVLPPGQYWLDWQTDGSLSSGPWAPPISILGETTTGDGLQSLDQGATWAYVEDTGTLTQQGFPFIIEGTAGGGNDIPWLSEDPIAGTVDPGNCTTVDVTFDSTGLAPGTYAGDLLIESNDPDEPEVLVGVELIVDPCTGGTMHVEDMIGWFNNQGRLVVKVLVADQDGAPLVMALVDADITTPMFDWARWRYTNIGGWAKFWAPLMYDGTYGLCVTNLTLDGYTYEPGDNVYTCMDWYYGD